MQWLGYNGVGWDTYKPKLPQQRQNNTFQVDFGIVSANCVSLGAKNV